MNMDQQSRIARGAGFHLGQVYRMKNGGEIVPLEVWERVFDGMVLVSYNAKAKGEKTYVQGDSTPATISSQIYGAMAD